MGFLIYFNFPLLYLVYVFHLEEKFIFLDILETKILLQVHIMLIFVNMKKYLLIPKVDNRHDKLFERQIVNFTVFNILNQKK